MWLTRLAIRNPVAVLMMSVAVLVLSLIAISRLPIDMFPGLNVPAISINTVYTGANPSEVERTITHPLEQAVSRVSGIARVQSTSQSGRSQIQVWFEWGANLDSAIVDIISNVQRAMRALPPGVDPPSVTQFDVTNFPVVQLVLEAPDMDPKRLYELAEYTLSPQLERIPGVSDVEVRGGIIRQINVNCDPQKLQARGLTLQEVQDALRVNNQLIPSGSLENPRVEYQLQIPTLLEDMESIEQVVVATRRGVTIKVRDVATVEDGTAPLTNIYEVNGARGVGLMVLMQPRANVVKLSDEIAAALPHLAGLPKGASVRMTFDQSNYVRTAIRSLVHEGVGGALLVSLVVLVFLRNLKSVLIICISIPLSVAAALVMLYLGDQSLNVFTLGGLTLALGRLVDDAIVVRENITRHLEEDGPPPEDPEAQGPDRRDNRKREIWEAVLRGTEEVGMPVLASTLTTIAVFVPVVFLQGISQKLFVPLAMTIIFSMVASYLVSMTVDPVLSVAWIGQHDARPSLWSRLSNGVVRVLERLFNALENLYERLLRFSLANPLLIMAALVACMASAAILAPGIPTEFFPESDESVVTVRMQAQLGTSLTATTKFAREVEAAIKEEIRPEERLAILTSAGIPSNQANLFVRLVQPVERRRNVQQISAALRKVLVGKFPGLRIIVNPGGMAKRVLNYGATAPIDVQLLGYDQEVGSRVANEIARLLAQVPGATDIQITPQGQVPSFRIDIDRERAALLGLTPARVAQTLNTAIAGGTGAGNRFVDPITGNEFQLVTRLKQEYRTHPEDLGSVPVTVLFSTLPTFRSPSAGITGDFMAPAGSPLRLRDVASIQLGSAPLSIQRKNQVRVIDITANNNLPLGQVSAGVEEALKEVKLPPGFITFLAGQTEQQKAAFSSMSLAAGLALMLVYMIMASQFGSLWEPLVIMLTVPLGLVGVVWMQRLTSTPFSVMSFMGVIMMVGIVVSNGILMVEFAKTLEERGEPLLEAVVKSSRIRLRPILMTAIATIVGMIPMATGLGGGSETNQPLARAVVGGLTVSTVLTLFVVPLFYKILARLVGGRRS